MYSLYIINYLSPSCLALQPFGRGSSALSVAAQPGSSSLSVWHFNPFCVALQPFLCGTSALSVWHFSPFCVALYPFGVAVATLLRIYT